MERSRGVETDNLAGSGFETGFELGRKRVASSRLIDAVMASLMLGSLSLCFIVAMTMLSIKAVMVSSLAL